MRVRVAESVRDPTGAAARGVHEGGRRRRARQLVEGHVLPEVLIPLPALDAGPLVDVALGSQGARGLVTPFRRTEDGDDFSQHLGDVEVRAARRQLAPDALAVLVLLRPRRPALG